MLIGQLVAQLAAWMTEVGVLEEFRGGNSLRRIPDQHGAEEVLKGPITNEFGSSCENSGDDAIFNSKKTFFERKPGNIYVEIFEDLPVRKVDFSSVHFCENKS